MKKMIIFIVFLSLLMTGCNNMVHFTVNVMDTNSSSENIKKWIVTNKQANGIYLCQTVEKGHSKDFYLYINNSNSDNNKYYTYHVVSIDSSNKNAIYISVKQKESTQPQEILFKITPKNSIIKSIILNEEDIKVTSIPTIPS